MRYAALMLLSAAVAGSPFFARPDIMSSDATPQSPAAQRLFIGTYTGKGSKGIYTVRMDPQTGQLSDPVLAAEAENPSFLAFHPGKPVLYAVNETSKFEGAEGGGVTAFAVGKDGALTKLNAQPTKGGGPCYLTVDKSGSSVLLANYGGGSFALLPIDAADGKLKPVSAFVQDQGSSVNPQRQKGPHAHSINVDPSGRFALAADLGLDKLFVFRLDPRAGTLTAHEPASAATAPGAGPRHLAFHPNGKIAYVINELSSTIAVFTWDQASGVLKQTQSVRTLPDEFTGESWTAEVQVHPSGRFVYGSNRGHDSIAIFAANAADGQLKLVGYQPTGGKTPRNFGIDPSGQFLLAANQASDSIVVFRIDQTTGRLTPTGASVTVPAPVCVKFSPSSWR
jgi:6-phosphogluconolactonase